MTRRMAWALRASRERPAWYRVGPVRPLAAKGDSAGKSGGEDSGKPPTSADVYLFDVIGGWWGCTAEDFVREVGALDVDRIVLHLNSPGGDAAEGVAIANVLRAHRARIVVRVDGMAASAASVVAMAGDEVVMGIGSQMMLHDAWGYAQGNAAEMAAAQRMLDSTSDALAATYAAKAGGTIEQWREVMRAETWYSAEEAVAAGLADRVATPDEVGTAEGEQITPGASTGELVSWWDSMRDPSRFDELISAAYAYAGREHAPTPVMPGRQTPAAHAAGDGSTQEGVRAVAFTPEQLTTMRQRLGVADDADEQTILDALIEALDEQAVDEPAAAQLPDGVVAIDAAQLDDLRRRAERGDEARAQQEREHRERLVDAAVRDGRIPAARRDAWLTMLAADPGAEATLASLAKGVVPVAEIGRDDTADMDPDELLYQQLYGAEG